MAQGWYVLRTEPMAEYIAAEGLVRDGYEVFFPTVKSLFHRAGHSDAPLFPSYLFIRCDPEVDGSPVFRPSNRIAGWVNFGGEVPTVPDDVMAELTRRLDAIKGGEGLWKRFAPGDKVRVLSTTLDSVAEVVEESKSAQGKAKVLLQFMGRVIQAQVPWEYLKPLQDQPFPKLRPARRTRGKGRWIEGFGHRVGANG